MTNTVDSDQTPGSVASDLGLHYLIRSVCLSEYLRVNTYGKQPAFRVPLKLICIIHGVVLFAICSLL